MRLSNPYQEEEKSFKIKSAVIWTRSGKDRYGVWLAIDSAYYCYRSTFEKFRKKFKLVKEEGRNHFRDTKDLLAKEFGIAETGVVVNPYCTADREECIMIEGFYLRYRR